MLYSCSLWYWSSTNWVHRDDCYFAIVFLQHITTFHAVHNTQYTVQFVMHCQNGLFTEIWWTILSTNTWNSAADLIHWNDTGKCSQIWEWVSDRVKAHKSSHYTPRCHSNKNDFSCRRNSLLSGWRILAGRLFQSCGPAAAKLRLPNRVLVRETQHVSMSANRSQRWPAWETSWHWQSSTRYAAVESWSTL